MSPQPQNETIIERRVPVLPVAAPSPSPLLLLAVVSMTTVGVVSIIAVGIWAPERSATLIGQIVAMLLPTTAALLAVLKSSQNTRAIQDVSIAIDGRLTELLHVTAISQRAQGNIEGAKQALGAAAIQRETGRLDAVAASDLLVNERMATAATTNAIVDAVDRTTAAAEKIAENTLGPIPVIPVEPLGHETEHKEQP